MKEVNNDTELRQLCELKERNLVLRGELSSVYSSWSWRITKPLRFVSEKIRFNINLIRTMDDVSSVAYSCLRNNVRNLSNQLDPVITGVRLVAKGRFREFMLRTRRFLRSRIHNISYTRHDSVRLEKKVEGQQSCLEFNQLHDCCGRHNEQKGQNQNGDKYYFALDFPLDKKIDRVTTFSGWCFCHVQLPKMKIELSLDGQPHTELRSGLYRPDLQKKYCDVSHAAFAGFTGDLVIPLKELNRGHVFVEISVQAPHKDRTVLFNSVYKVKPTIKKTKGKNRLKRFDVHDLVQCPDCRGELIAGEFFSHCPDCNRNVYLRQSVPHILNSGDLPVVCVTQRGLTHPYGPKVAAIMNQVKDGLILDFGSGNTPTDCIKPNVVYLDTIQFPNTDIVSNTPHLPIKDCVFDLIVSQAVFEHIPNPFLTALEFLRILKPGGEVYLDTAFMQPLHGDPSHYFNMTLEGIRIVMSEFEEIESGVGPHQTPSYGIIMGLETLIPHVKDNGWIGNLKLVLDYVRENQIDFDAALGDCGRKALAAGVYFWGRKPILEDQL